MNKFPLTIYAADPLSIFDATPRRVATFETEADATKTLAEFNAIYAAMDNDVPPEAMDFDALGMWAVLMGTSLHPGGRGLWLHPEFKMPLYTMAVAATLKAVAA